MKFIKTLTAVVLMCSASTVLNATPASVPVEVWSDSLQVSNLDMSPDAKRIAMLMRRTRGGDPELFIFETSNIKSTLQAIQPEGLTPTSLRWANEKHLVVNFYFETEDAGTPVRLSRTASFNVETQEWTPLIRTTTRKNIRDTGGNLFSRLGIGRVVSILPDEPEYVLIEHNEERGSAPNYYKTHLDTGERSLVLKGNYRLSGYIWDREGKARAAMEYDSGDIAIVSLARESDEDDWKEVGRLRAADRDRFEVLGFFDADKPYLATVVAETDDREYTAIYTVDIRDGSKEMVFRTENYDATGVILSPRLADGTKVVGYRYADEEGYQKYYTDDTYGPLYRGLQQAFPGRNVTLQRVSKDGKTTLIYTSGPQDPGSWYLFKDGKVAPIISASTEITSAALSPVEVLKYKARDGLEMSGYVTTPSNTKGPYPLIAMPHGGPWVRDSYGYDRWAQMLANKGYAVFQPNYRGSVDLGRSHWLAGDKKWGYQMQDDIEDGVNALIKKGIADPKKLAMFGWSYGGYAAFTAATRENNMFNCIVSGAGVSDLTRIRGGISGSRFQRVFQKPTIDGVSPVDLTSKVKVPMLIVHGDLDRTVPVEHSRMYVEGLEKANADFEYIEIEDMEHSPYFYEQNMQWFPQLFEFFDTKCKF